MSTSLRPFFTYKLLSEFLLIVPVLVPFYTASGLSALEIFLVQAAYSASQLLCEVPSGYVADVIGRKRTLVIGATLFVAGLSLYAVSGSFAQFVAAEIVLGIGGAMRSGAESALLFDTLKMEGRELQYQHLEGRAELLTRIGTAISSLLGGVLASVSLRLPFYANVAAAAALLAAATGLREPARAARPAGHPLRNILTIVRRSVGDAVLRPVMLLWALTLASGIVGIWGYFLYFAKAGVPLAWYGIVFALIQTTSGLGAHGGVAVEERLGSAKSLATVVLIAASLVPFGLWTSPWVVPFALAHAALWGLSTPLLLARINHATGSDVRATVLSTGAMMGRVLSIILGIAFGRAADRLSIGGAFLGLALVHGVMASALVLAIVGREARSRPGAS